LKKEPIMTDAIQITNPNLETKSSVLMAGTNLIQCNKCPDVYKHIKTGKNYVIELPATNTILNVTCTFAAIRAADMKINSCTVNGIEDHDSEDCTFSYEYENFDSVHYTSFSYREVCIVYMSVNDM